jgi:hypothetical protein
MQYAYYYGDSRRMDDITHWMPLPDAPAVEKGCQMAWKDTSSWSRGEQDRSEPKSMELRTESLRLSLHRHMDYGRNWLVSCYSIGIDNFDLGDIPLEEAKHKAVLAVKQKLEQYLMEMEDAILKLGSQNHWHSI